MVTVVEMTDYQMGWIDYENGLPLEGADWDELIGTKTARKIKTIFVVGKLPKLSGQNERILQSLLTRRLFLYL